MIVKDEWHRTTKERTCGWCYSPIVIGEPYRYLFGGMRDHMFSMYLCQHCGITVEIDKHDTPIKEEGWSLHPEEISAYRSLIFPPT